MPQKIRAEAPPEVGTLVFPVATLFMRLALQSTTRWRLGRSAIVPVGRLADGHECAMPPRALLTTTTAASGAQ